MPTYRVVGEYTEQGGNTMEIEVEADSPEQAEQKIKVLDAGGKLPWKVDWTVCGAFTYDIEKLP